jgi:hypothetical protein
MLAGKVTTMSTELPTNCTDAEILYHYLGEQMSRAGRDTPLDELLSGFLLYRRELHDLRAKLRAAEDSSARGESKELDVESLIAEVTHQLASEGIID